MMGLERWNMACVIAAKLVNTMLLDLWRYLQHLWLSVHFPSNERYHLTKYGNSNCHKPVQQKIRSLFNKKTNKDIISTDAHQQKKSKCHKVMQWPANRFGFSQCCGRWDTILTATNMFTPSLNIFPTYTKMGHRSEQTYIYSVSFVHLTNWMLRDKKPWLMWWWSGITIGGGGWSAVMQLTDNFTFQKMCVKSKSVPWKFWAWA